MLQFRPTAIRLEKNSCGDRRRGPRADPRPLDVARSCHGGITKSLRLERHADLRKPRLVCGSRRFSARSFSALNAIAGAKCLTAGMQGRRPRRYSPWQHHSCTPPPHRGSVSRGCGRSPAVTTTIRLRWGIRQELATAIGAPCYRERHRHGLASFPGASRWR